MERMLSDGKEWVPVLVAHMHSQWGRAQAHCPAPLGKRLDKDFFQLVDELFIN